MQFSISVIKNDLLGIIFLPYFIKKVTEKDYFKRLQQVSGKEILKHKFLQEDWIINLIELTDNFNPKKLNQKFNKQHQKITFKNYYKNATKQQVSYISKTIDVFKIKIVEILKNKKPLLFIQPKKDAFIYDFIDYSNQLAQVKFHFKKEEESLFYKLSLYINEKKVILKNSNLIIVTNNSPCVIYKDKLIWFDSNITFNGNKLKPFLVKDEIIIPNRMQEVYFEKFVKNAVLNFEYKITGFKVKYIETKIEAVLNFEKTFQNKFIISLYFNYNTKNVPFYWEQNEFVKVIKIDNQYALESFKRDTDFETEKIDALVQMGLIKKDKYFEFLVNHSSESEFINYLKPFIKKIKSENFTIENRLFKKKINFEKPKISYSSQYKQDWFDLKIVIQFKGFEIPFYKFKDHILNHISEFELPNETIFIIPNEWFTELNAFAKRTDTDNKTHFHVSNFSLLKKNKFVAPDDSIKNKIIDFSTIKKIELPKNSIATLRDYQNFGYQWLARNTQNNFGVCLADDMGLGKTLQVITLLQNYFEDKLVNTSLNKQLDLFSLATQNTNTFKSAILVLPRVLIINWKEELQKFAPELTFCIYYGTKREEILTKNLHKKQLILTTYGVIRQDIEILKNIDFSYLILDESQAIKNPNSKIYKAVVQMQSDFKISITGTPIENKLIDIWSQMNFLNPNMLGNLTYFKNAYVETINNNAKAPEIEDLKTIINSFILRRLKKDVAKELPDKIEQIIYCQMDEEQQKHYDKKKSAVRNELLFKKEKNMIHVFSVLNKLRQFVLHPKLIDAQSTLNSGKFEQIKATIKTLIAQKSKFLIFSSFVKHLNIYKTFFEENNIAFNMLTGKSKNPQEIVKQYQESDEIKPFLISIKAGGVGLNITSANYVLIIDPWWNPFVEQQAIDRTHRIGQTKNVFIYKFITKNSIEEKILNLQNRKREMSDSLINGNTLKISMDEITDLL